MKKHFLRRRVNIPRRGWCFIYLFILMISSFSACRAKTASINDIPIFIDSNQFYYFNTCQNNTAIQMQASDGELYIYLPVSSKKSETAIYRFNQNGATELDNILIFKHYRQLWNDDVVGFCNGSMYIKRYPEKDNEVDYPKKAELIYYDLVAENSETLISTEEAAYMSIELDENGLLYVSTREISTDGERQYQAIQKNILLGDKISQLPYVPNGSTSEVLENYNRISPMLTENQMNNAVESLIELGLENKGCTLYPFENGWLLHISKSNIPLCLVSCDGRISPIIEYDCLSSSSSFNYHGDYAFLSIIRYEKWDDEWGYFLQPYENDNISGTYRIDLTDYSITKVSDNYYSGIFIFDEMSIFVCDVNDGVYQMDHSGNLISSLLEPKGN